MTGVKSGQRDEALPRGIQGAADPSFACTLRAFSRLFPGRRYGGGALAVYLHGEPVLDVWTGYADRRGTEFWTADTGAMVFSVTKGLASTVVHRLADRGLIDYDTPVAEYWPDFGANGKDRITVRQVMQHRAGLSHLNGCTKDELLDHQVMEARVAASPVNKLLYGHQAYHALTYGWLLSGLVRAITGKGMRTLIREELAEPLNTDGLHLGRPPAGAPTRAAQILAPQNPSNNPVFNFVAPRVAALGVSGIFGSIYFPGVRSVMQGDTPFLDAEIPAANGVATARALARMYGAIANGGRIDGVQFLSEERVAALTGRPSLWPDRNVLMPLSFHLGYHSVPVPPGLLPGFGHAGLAGSVGWADPSSGLAFGFVHNRLLTPMVFDQAVFAGLGVLIRRDADRARRRGYQAVPELGAAYTQAARSSAAV
ncbi:penicillin-binding protein, beta-lactamase class C [Mycolicibacterium phlei]|uniref:Esterase n=1 Tax=Mycolicibacterium phlei DSM 43239 = CCUG 21000 TaxID=1226750 RepID=A0A5N5V748_MYCPH|nr:serine hydrolase domain-containing protein [Mycolicibacterium phlei]VEG09769.1 penicillin-binding protein, beta-lactamase class C [Mycobacteroides chelonae]AMO61662.1 D-alanyl-D-alanine carboxypeptidase precursor [Mycolicibacterium phlei]EID18149.1 penicillin-binding protein, beta-lactamase class C [Mycolicibacterium phlei RIVM601174]KAB7757518.1 esterase [Mycolicibacterium phlei DSM 43239 = CCUG 21000]KXW63109.1 esterase [Mycolicibacterium phlei DSM 43070]